MTKTKKVHVSVNGKQLEVEVGIALEGHFDHVIRNEVMFKSEMRWGPGLLVGEGQKFQWEASQAPAATPIAG